MRLKIEGILRNRTRSAGDTAGMRIAASPQRSPDPGSARTTHQRQRPESRGWANRCQLGWGAVKRGVHIPNVGPFGSARVVAELATSAEASGWDGVFVWDHVVRREGDVDIVDPWVALAAAAVATAPGHPGPGVD